MFLLYRYLIIRIVPPFVVGIVLAAFATEYPLGQWVLPASVVAFLIAGVLAYLVADRESWHFNAAANVTMLMAGGALTLINSSHLFSSSLPLGQPMADTVYTLRLLEDPLPKARSFKVNAELCEARIGGRSGMVLAYLANDTLAAQLRAGDLIVARCSPQPTRMNGNPGEFNYPRFLRFRGIYHQCFIAAERWQLAEAGYQVDMGQHLLRWRNNMLSIIERAGLTGSEFSVASALTLGHRTEIDRELLDDYSGAGATHVLSVSGLHVGLIYVMLGFILRFLIPGKRLERPRSIVLMILLVVYAGITGFSASVLRSTVMFVFMAGARLFDRSTNIFNTLAASALGLLIYDPYLIMDVGFQLSYLAVLGIVTVQPWLFGLWEVKNWAADWVWKITCVSIAAQLVTFPLGLLYFHQFPNLFLFSNLVVIPVATAILGLFFPLVLLSWWDCGLQFFGFLMKWTVWFLNWSVGFINDLPHAVWKGIEVSTGQSLFIYTTIAAVLVVLVRRNARLLIPALFSLLGVMVFDAFDLYLAHHQRFTTVYNVNGHQAISVMEGRTVHFYADPEFLSDTSGIDFHVRHHWWSSLADNINMHPISGAKDTLPIIATTGPRILCFNRQDAEVLLDSRPDDILYIHGARWAELERMAELFAGKEVIIGSGMGKGSALRAKDVFSHHPAIKVTDLRNGAITFSH